jgi:hypothetical protein
MLLHPLSAIALLLSLLPEGLSAQPDRAAFACPSQSARPSTYWEWMNGNISERGITADLEYMKAAGYGGAMIFESAVGIPRGPVDYNGSAWHHAVVHAMKEARRLGLRLMMHAAPGYSGLGGPWIRPEESMKQLVWTESYVHGGKVILRLPRPFMKLGYYRDAYVLAYPSFDGEADFRFAEVTLDGKPVSPSILTDHDLATELRIEKGQQLVIRLDRTMTLASALVYRGRRETPLDPHDGPRDYAPKLSVECSTDGINYARSGDFSCAPLRAADLPGSFDMARAAVRYVRITSDRGTNLAELILSAANRENVIDPAKVVDITSCLGADGLLRWKAPRGRWTVVRIGYTTTGEEVAASPDSGAGLCVDVLSKSGVDAHFDHFLTPLIHELAPWCGNTFEGFAIDSWEVGKQDWSPELPEWFSRKRGYDLVPWMLAAVGKTVGSAGKTAHFIHDWRRTQTDMFNANFVDHFRKRLHAHGLRYAGEAYGDGNMESLEMAARQDMPMSEFWTHYIYGNITTTHMAASAAHVYGQNIVACECYTGTPFASKFTEHPYGMKALADYIMASGVNRFVYHCTTHQPYTGPQEGNIMTMGPFGTHLDRMNPWAKAFASFNAYVSRSCYLLQQGRFVGDLVFVKDSMISSGVRNYADIVPDGYRWDILSEEALREHPEYARDKIIVPAASSDADHVWRQIQARKFVPDFSYMACNADAQITFIHRRMKTASGDTHIYFVANLQRRPETITASFRVEGLVPTIWNAETGETDLPVAYEERGGRTYVNLRLSQVGSVFVVFTPGEGHPVRLSVVKQHQIRRQPSSFTISHWIRPEVYAAPGRGMVIDPPGGEGDTARVGYSAGTNGIRVFEHHQDQRREVIRWLHPISGWTHVRIQYRDNTPSLLIGDSLVVTGVRSGWTCVSGEGYDRSVQKIASGFEGDLSLDHKGYPRPSDVCLDLSRNWAVSFPVWSKARDLMLDSLVSLSVLPDFNVRHFSGTATYSKSFSVNKLQTGRRYLLNLGDVQHVAEVSINGSRDTILWKAPFTLDVTRYLKRGENTLRIRVTNNFVNRIIGDEHLPERYDYDAYGRIRQLPAWYLSDEADNRERVLFLPWKFYTKDDPLEDSGLLGPVLLSPGVDR